MLAILRRVAEVRRQRHAADALAEPVEYTISPVDRALEISGLSLGKSFRTTFAILFSSVVHLALLVVVVAVPIAWLEREPQPDEPIMIVQEEEPPPPPLEEMAANLTLAAPDKQWQEHKNVTSSIARSEGWELNPKVALERTPFDEGPNRSPKMEVLPPVQPVQGAFLTLGLPRKGAAGVETKHVEGAVDRLTYEIASQLEQKKVIVVWLMDASLSLVKERKEVASHLERVFKELGELKLLKNDALTNAVIAYGVGTKVLVDPTSDTAKVVAGIRNVPDDESGLENTFAAIQFAIDRYQTRVTHERRKMIIVNWTDESGDDYKLLDHVIANCQKFSIPVYTVGTSAMFGKEHGRLPYVSPEDNETYMLPVCRGPDSVHQEQLELPFWFTGSQFTNLHAGLSPFALTRIAYETGGAYFIKDPPGDVSEFDVSVMARYAPEYDSVTHYIRRVQASPLRRAVMQVVEMSKQRTIKANPILQLAPTGATFQQDLLEAQKSSAFNLDVLDQMLVPFGQGFEKEYGNEKSPRWQAWYDYTYGRLLAMRVRNFEYNALCSVFKGKGREFVDQKSNRWRFVPDPKLSGTVSQKQAAEATRLLRRCIDMNPGTPWAVLAQRELKDPLGMKIEEAYVAPPPPPPKAKAGPAPKVVVPPPVVPAKPAKQAVPQPNMLPRPKEVKLPKL